jgi:hypothetical protein
MASIKDKVLSLFKPDKSGNSDWVVIEKFEEAGLRWTANGNLRRGTPWGMNDYIWEVERGAGRKVTALRMAGLNKSDSFNQTISPQVRSKLEFVFECNISMLPVPRPDREIDHRYGFKGHPDYVEMYKPENQRVQDFQLIHRVLNLQKRQMCVECVDLGKRPPHPTLGYAEGDQSLSDNYPCRGCFLAEPERFRGLNN